MLCAGLKIILFLSFVTADVPELASSHVRAVLIYTESLDSSCTLWGVKPNESDLNTRYGT